MISRIRKLNKFMYFVQILKHGIWIDCSNPMPLCDAKALKERIQKWESQ